MKSHKFTASFASRAYVSLEQAQRWLERSNEHLERTEEGAREAHREYLDAKNLLVRVRQAVSFIAGWGWWYVFTAIELMLTSCVYFFKYYSHTCYISFYRVQPRLR